jgi:hypothetical protein
VRGRLRCWLWLRGELRWSGSGVLMSVVFSGTESRRRVLRVVITRDEIRNGMEVMCCMDVVVLVLLLFLEVRMVRGCLVRGATG